MPFLCYLCNITTCYTTYFCEDCTYIKRILQCYGKEEIKDIITKVCIRNTKQITNKIEIIKTKLDKKEGKEDKKEDKEEYGDNTYINNDISNLNKNMITELKKRLN